MVAEPFLHQLREVASLDEVHHVVGRLVFLKSRMDLYDAWMVEFCDISRFPEEFHLKVFYEVAGVVGSEGHPARGGLPVAIVFREEFLDGHIAFEPCLVGEIGDSESSLPENALS